ncbi:MAG: hypothetical protein E6R13_02095 [Spirochaetes bacterium]|nr:MAG: hypothetical protein E6R13_02095 [Spirochaetota bacterium]
MNLVHVIISGIISFIITRYGFGMTNENSGWLYWVTFIGISMVIDAILDHFFIIEYDADIERKKEKKKNKKINLETIENINVAVGVSNKEYPQVDVKQVDNHLYINGEEVRAIRFKDGTYKTIGQIIK